MNLNISRHLQKTMLLRLIAYFVLIITISLSTLSYFTYSYFSTSFKNEITEFNHRVLNQVSIISDEYVIKKINNMALNQIMGSTESSDINKLFDDYSTENWDLIFNANYKLNSLALQNEDVVDAIFVHSRSNNLLVSSTMKAMKYIDEKKAARSEEFNWISEFYKSNKSILWLKTRKARIYSDSLNGMGNIITVICSYPVSSTGDAVKGFIAVNIKEEVLSSYLIKFNSANTGKMMILDSNGEIISHSDKSSLYKDITNDTFVRNILSSDSPKDFKTISDNTEYMVSYVKSNYNNWYYVSMVPTRLFYQKNYLIRKRIFIVALIILIILLIFANFLSLKIYTPFRTILDKHMPSFGSSSISKKGISEYNLLDNLFNNMFFKINNLQNTLNKNTLMIKHNLLIDLLSNRISNPDTLENTFELLNMNLTKKFFCVVIFTIKKEIINMDQSNTHLYKYNIIDFIDSLNNDVCTYLHVDISSSSICVILNSDLIRHDDIVEFVSHVESFCLNKLNLQISAGTGSLSEDLLAINKSYIDAKICLQYKFIFPHKNAFYYDEIDLINSSMNTISGEFSDKFEKSLKLGIYNEVKETLDKFLSTVINNNIPYREVRRTMSTFTAIYIKFAESMNIDFDENIDEADRKKLYSPDNINEYIDILLKIIQTTYNFIATKKQCKNTDLVNKIKQFVIDNLHQDISLNSIADEFYISSFHLSKIFKEETGMHYIDYVINCKMDKAKNLLASSNLSIEKITKIIGYSHTTYFSRKFKELTGKTPNEYREEARIKP